MKATIYHNPNCGTSRKVLGFLRDKGIEPTVIEYLKAPPSRAELKDLVKRAGLTIRGILRKRGTPYDELNLGDESLSDDALLDAIEKHPILIERPIVATDKGVRLARPAELVYEIL